MRVEFFDGGILYGLLMDDAGRVDKNVDSREARQLSCNPIQIGIERQIRRQRGRMTVVARHSDSLDQRGRTSAHKVKVRALMRQG